LLGFDVVVIGSRLADMRVAVAAKDNGASITVITKAHLVRSYSNASQGVINSALTDRNDNWTKSWFWHN